jgi:hypothetical protein
MELISHDMSRVIYLVNVHRPQGQAYLPEAAAKLVQRYSFAKYPTLDDLQKDTVIFGIGKFRDVQISELGIYNDGMIIAAHCNTNLLDEMVSDLFAWMEKEVGLVQIKSLSEEKHYESALLVKASADISSAFAPRREVADTVASFLRKGTGVDYQTSGGLVDCDPAVINRDPNRRRKPSRFSVERRLGRPFSENLFYCQAPLKTDDHFGLLSALEDLASR